MVVTPKANDLTSREDFRGYTMGTLVRRGSIPKLRPGNCSYKILNWYLFPYDEWNTCYMFQTVR